MVIATWSNAPVLTSIVTSPGWPTARRGECRASTLTAAGRLVSGGDYERLVREGYERFVWPGIASDAPNQVRGNRNHYEVQRDAPMRHPLVRHQTLGQLLNALGSDVASPDSTVAP
jgi:hypothetical protein